jgi:hypothetical protein
MLATSGGSWAAKARWRGRAVEDSSDRKTVLSMAASPTETPASHRGGRAVTLPPATIRPPSRTSLPPARLSPRPIPETYGTRLRYRPTGWNAYVHATTLRPFTVWGHCCSLHSGVNCRLVLCCWSGTWTAFSHRRCPATGGKSRLTNCWPAVLACAGTRPSRSSIAPRSSGCAAPPSARSPSTPSRRSPSRARHAGASVRRTAAGRAGRRVTCAAPLLAAWSHPGRLRSQAAFAMLGGAAPVEASSGKVVRHPPRTAVVTGSPDRACTPLSCRA